MRQNCKLGDCVIKNYLFLKNLCNIKSEAKFAEFIKSATPEELRTVCEIVHNITIGNFKISKSRKEKLKDKVPIIRKIARSKCENQARKIIQKGGGVLPALLIPIVIEAAKYLLSK